MDTTTRKERRAPRPGTERKWQPSAKPNWEMHAWFFMRVSGLALVVLALTHWTLMHFINRLSVQNSEWIVARYQNVFWPTFDGLLLLFAMLHGTNGLRMIIDDHIQNRTGNMFAKGLLYAASFAFILLGLITIFMLPTVKVRMGM